MEIGNARYFPVYVSLSLMYLHFVMMTLPFLMLWLALETGFGFLYWVFALVLAICLITLSQLSAFLKIDASGVHLLRLFRKTIHLPWNRVICRGIVEKPFMGSIQPMKLCYFSAKPVSIPSLMASPSLPKLSEDFLFAGLLPGLENTVDQYCP